MTKRATLKVGADSIDLGTVSSITQSVNATTTVVPIVTMSSDNSFAMDAGSTANISISFTHKQGVNDSETNADWVKRLRLFVDRWQFKTDGATLEVRDDGEGYVHTMSENVYIKTLDFTHSNSSLETVTGTVQLTMGRYRLGSNGFTWTDQHGTEVDDDDRFFIMTSSDGTRQYSLYMGGSTGTEQCITSCTLTGGMEQQCEILQVKMSRKRLSVVAPDLVGDIEAGKNIIYTNLCGSMRAIVTSCSSSSGRASGTISVTAYGVAESYRSTIIRYGIPRSTTPFDTIKAIVCDNTSYGASTLRVYYPARDIVYCFREEYNKWGDADAKKDNAFESGQSASRVLNVCAAVMGCKLWFAEGKMFLIDPTVKPTDAGVVYSSGYLDSYYATYNDVTLTDANNKTSYADSPVLAPILVGSPELGDEGSDGLMNFITVTTVDGDETVTVHTSVDVEESRQDTLTEVLEASIDNYGLSKAEYTLNELDPKSAQFFADRYAYLFCEVQQPLSFVLAEALPAESGKGERWSPYFRQMTHMRSLTDDDTETPLDNRSILEDAEHPQLLCLSKYVRSYPECKTEYKFGMISPTDFTSTQSQLTSRVL